MTALLIPLCLWYGFAIVPGYVRITHYASSIKGHLPPSPPGGEAPLDALSGQEKERYYVDETRIPLDDIVEMGGKIYVGAKRLKRHWKLIWRTTLDGKRVGVYREGFGGGALDLGRGKPALVHTGEVYLSLDAIETVLNTKVERSPNKTVLRSRERMKRDPPTKRTGLVPGDRMIAFTFPNARNPNLRSRLDTLGPLLLFAWASWDRSREDAAKWSEFVRHLRRKHGTVAAVALDAEGEPGAGRYAGSATGVRILFDRFWRLAETLELRSLPQWILVDEWGFIRASGSRSRPEEILPLLERLDPPAASRTKAWLPEGEGRSRDLREALAKKESGGLRLALSRALFREGDRAGAAAEARRVLGKDPKSRAAAIHLAAALWGEGKRAEGVRVLGDLLRRDRSIPFFRRQKWAVEFPEKVYRDPFPAKWMSEQEDRELRGS